MRKGILGLLLTLLLLSPLSTKADAAGLPGVLIAVQGRIRCTGFNVLQVGDKVYALTATHCLHQGGSVTNLGTWSISGVLPAMLADALTGEQLGEGRPVYTNGDVSVLVYTSEKPVSTLPLTKDRPGFGNQVWGCGVVQDVMQAICFPGLWSGDSFNYQGHLFYIATLPVRPGFSGGPVGVGGTVFAIYSIQLGAALTGTTLVQPAIKFLEGVK